MSVPELPSETEVSSQQAGPPEPATALASAKPTLAAIASWIGLGALVASILQVLFDAASRNVIPIGIFVALAAAVVVIGGMWVRAHRHRVLPALIDLRFGVVILASIALATCVGTLVVQTNNNELFYGRYGSIAPVLTWLHLHDVFHSWWFAWLLIITACALLASIARRRMWRKDQVGFLLLHTGLLLLLGGGLIGGVFGSSGMLHLQTNKSANYFVDGKGKKITLPFMVRLDDFTVERRKPRYRLYLVEQRGAQQKVLASYDAASPSRVIVDGYGRIELLRLSVPESAATPKTARAKGLWLDPSKGKVGVDETTQKRALQPAVELRVWGPNGARELTLGGDGERSLALGDQKSLLFGKRSDDVINYSATVAILDGDRQVLSKKVSVNNPLHYGGFTLYQANFDAKNPSYAGLLVVSDPGYRFVLLGLVGLLLGVAHLMAIPRRRRRETAS